MKLQVSVEINHPREKVFETYRDKLPDLVPYLPNVRGISVSDRKDEGNVVRLVNRWKGGGEIPALVRKFLADDLFEWDDYATWLRADFITEWKTVVPAVKDAVRAEGKNYFEEISPTRTRLRIDGDIVVDAGKIKGVPRLLGGTIGPAVEKFLVERIKPNLIEVSQGLEKYLNEHK